MRLFKKFLYVFLWICYMSVPAHSSDISIACAANFTSAMKELVALYEDETGIKGKCTFGSTGMLYGQIKHGAPYDLFFAADTSRPTMLHAEGLALTPEPYAKGQVVLWTNQMDFKGYDNWKDVVCLPEISRVGIASPKTAPYGLSATEALATAHILGKTEPKFAYGKSVGSAFQYAYAGAADVAFVALSQALSDKGATGVYWVMPEAPFVEQAACVIKGGNEESAHIFMSWLSSPKARGVMKEYGYE